jgi:Tol biopolymer transport system component
MKTIANRIMRKNAPSGNSNWNRTKASPRRVKVGSRLVAATLGSLSLAASGQDHDIVFCSNRAGNHDIWRMNEDGTGLRQLTNTSADESSVVPSPDGRLIAYTRVTSGTYQARLMNADGTNDRVLKTYPSGTLCYTLDWFPDGSAILVSSGQICALQLQKLALDGSQTPLLHPSVVGQAEMSPYSCRFSPDGRKIAFGAQAGCWSPTTEIYVADYAGGVVDTSSIYQLTSNAQMDDWLVFSPDGNALAHTHGTGPHGYPPPGEIRVVNCDHSASPARISGSYYTAHASDWAPHHKILFGGQPTSADPVNVYSMHPDGTGVTKLTSGAFNEGGARWLLTGNSSFESDDEWIFSENDPYSRFTAGYSTEWSSDGARCLRFRRGTGTSGVGWTQAARAGVDLTGVTRVVFDCQDTGIDSLYVQFLVDDVIVAQWTNGGWPLGGGGAWGHTTQSLDIDLPFSQTFSGPHTFAIRMAYLENRQQYWPADPKIYRIDNVRLERAYHADDYRTSDVGGLPAGWVIQFDGLGASEQGVREESGIRYLRAAGMPNWSSVLRHDFDEAMPDKLRLALALRQKDPNLDGAFVGLGNGSNAFGVSLHTLGITDSNWHNIECFIDFVGGMVTFSVDGIPSSYQAAVGSQTVGGWSWWANKPALAIAAGNNGFEEIHATNIMIETLGNLLTVPAVAGGSVTGAGTYARNHIASLVPVPAAGYVFTGWSGDASGNISPLQTLMNGNKTIIPVFGPDTADTDGDGLSNYNEAVIHGTDPLRADSDGDGLNDNQELNTVGSNPLLADTDRDGLADGDEVNTHGSNPMNPDTDDDGLNDGDEVNAHRSNPTLKDTDGDGFDDKLEVDHGFDPATATSTPESKAEMLQAVEFRFYGAKGKTYRIESSTDLQTWTPVEAGIAGHGGMITRLYSVQGIPKRNFRAGREE